MIAVWHLLQVVDPFPAGVRANQNSVSISGGTAADSEYSLLHIVIVLQYICSGTRMALHILPCLKVASWFAVVCILFYCQMHKEE